MDWASAKVTPRKGLGSSSSTTAYIVETLGFGLGKCKGHTKEGFRVMPFNNCIPGLDFRVWIGQVPRSHQGKVLGSSSSTTAYMVETLGFGFGKCQGHTKESFRVITIDNCIHG